MEDKTVSRFGKGIVAVGHEDDAGAEAAVRSHIPLFTVTCTPFHVEDGIGLRAVVYLDDPSTEMTLCGVWDALIPAGVDDSEQLLISARNAVEKAVEGALENLRRAQYGEYGG